MNVVTGTGATLKRHRVDSIARLHSCDTTRSGSVARSVNLTKTTIFPAGQG